MKRGFNRGGVEAGVCGCMNARARLTMKAAVTVGEAVEEAVAAALYLRLRGCSLRRAAARRLPLRIIELSPRTIFSAMWNVLFVPVPIPR